MDLLSTIFLSVVEGFTEFLPISSTGHLILLTKVLGVDGDFTKSFEIIIQLGAILSVIVLYGKILIGNPKLISKIIIAFLPAGVLGFALHSFIKDTLFSSIVVVWSLMIGGVVMIVFELLHKEKNGSLEELANIPYSKAVGVGFFQLIAMIPGVSRAAATILGGMAIGLKRRVAVEFSFLLALPTMLGASGLEFIKNFRQFSANDMSTLAIGFVVSFVTAVIGIKFLLVVIKKDSFIKFGIYRIALAVLFLFLII